METKARKKGEAFSMEAEVLRSAREKLEDSSTGETGIREAYAFLCDEYEKLLDEVKFLTKISDKLEAKLNAANEKLQQANQGLASEVESTRTEKDVVLQRNKKLYEEKTKLDYKMNRFQFTLLIIMAILVIVLIMAGYWLITDQNPFHEGLKKK